MLEQNDTLVQNYETIESVKVLGTFQPDYEEILTKEAQVFLKKLHHKFEATRKQLLARRVERQEALDQGAFPDFLPETRHIREAEWTVAAIPNDLLDRRVEITGPVDRKMIINALNSGAKVFMADFEDSNSPTWKNNLDGQVNLRDANLGTITYQHPIKNKTYQLKEEVATLMVRPRGWHLVEAGFSIDGEAISASLFDFGLYFFHNAKTRWEKGRGCYFYLPKLESHLEARLWNEVFIFAQEELQIPQGSIRATVLIETILAAFEIDEILWELKDHSAGLNCGRWDYIFSFIKRFSKHKDFVMPNRAQVGMEAHCMKSYSELVVQTCHKRGIHAMGGMAAQIPVKNDEAANQAAFSKIKEDKKREAMNGHDGTWVAHPGLVQLAMDTFNEYMPKANSIENKRLDINISAADLLETPKGTITEEGVRENINVGILYIENWLRGNGAAALYHKMEDAATAEISRAQLWQWIRHEAVMQGGKVVSMELILKLLPEEMDKLHHYVGDAAFQNGRFDEAEAIFMKLISAKEFPEFLTLEAYDNLI